MSDKKSNHTALENQVPQAQDWQTRFESARRKQQALMQELGFLPASESGKPRPLPLPVSIPEHAKEEAAQTIQEVLPPTRAPEQVFLPIAPMPTDLCRVSPFFPMRANDKAERKFIENIVITKSSWGEILYTGPQLSTYEEDALLAVLAVLDALRDKNGYTYKGPVLPLLKIMGYKKVGKKTYNTFVHSLKLMLSSVFELHIKEKSRTFNNILSCVKVDKDTKDLTVTVNPYFYEMYIAGRVTLVDVLERRKLKKATSKCLYRFIMSHRSTKWEGHFMTLAASLNLNQDQPKKEIRRQIKEAVAEMKKNGMLKKSSGFVRRSKEVVFLERENALAKK